ncbi:multidrug resistance [Fusarium sp. NRRL 52700]|nr:multidrug resistance [Fusarium sp. NRRL 52700]
MPNFNGRETDSLLCRDPFCEPALEDSEIRHDHRYLSCGSTKSDPWGWSPLYKWTIVLLLTFMGFCVSFSCLSIVPVSSEIISELSDTKYGSKYANVLVVTIWELGEAAGPLILAPLSENIGRRPVANSANLLFILSNILAALSQNPSTYILARFCSGLTVTCNVLNPAVIGDMFAPQHRGSPLSLTMLAPFIGGAVDCHRALGLAVACWDCFRPCWNSWGAFPSLFPRDLPDSRRGSQDSAHRPDNREGYL